MTFSITDNHLSTTVHYKPTDSHSYLLYSHSHPKHTLNAIPFSQFLRLRRLCSDDNDFSNKCIVSRTDRNTALTPNVRAPYSRIPFTLTYFPINTTNTIVIILYSLLKTNTSQIFNGRTPLSNKRDRNLRSFLVKGVLPSKYDPGTFRCSRKVCNTCPYILSHTSIVGPNSSLRITDHFECTTSNVDYCIKCSLCNLLYVGETGRRLGDRIREHLYNILS